MRYRRLGGTEWMVSETGLDLRTLEGLDEAAAGATLGAALARGVTLILVDAREHEGGVEPLIGRVTTSERPRLVVLSRFERIAEAPALEAQLRAAGTRISDDGYLDVAVFRQVPDAAQCAVLQALAGPRAVRAWGIETGDPAVAARAFAAGARVLVTPEPADALLACASDAGAGVVVDTNGVPTTALGDGRVTSVMAEASQV